MTPITAAVIGYDRIGKRVADALLRQPDMRLTGVVDADPLRQEVLRARGIPVVNGDLVALAKSCDVLVACRANDPRFSVPVVFGPHVVADCPLFLSDRLANGVKQVRIPCADAVAFWRLLERLPPVERLFSSCARRTEDAGRPGFGCADALTPIFELPEEDADLRSVLAALVPLVIVRRTQLPYTHSHVHHVKLDLKSAVTREEALKSFRANARIRVASGAAGFADTGHVQEFDRDLGRPRGDRPEIFVWEESVAAIEQSLILTLDVDPDATVIPEMIDAVRRLARPEMSLEECRRMTDGALSLGGAR